MKILPVIFLLLLSGCFYRVAGFDMSVEGRHGIWVHLMKKKIGESVFQCPPAGGCYQDRGPGSLFQGDTLLENGNKEAAYIWWHTQPRCRYFFEYEPRTGLIVGFRFEEAQRYACRISGA